MGSTDRPGMRAPGVFSTKVALALLGALTLATARANTDIEVSSGGVGADQRAEMAAARGEYNLWLVFASTRSLYLAGVDVELYQARDGAYHEVYSGRAKGPWLHARVPAGR